MSTLSEDPVWFDHFKSQSSNLPPSDKLPLHVIEWGGNGHTTCTDLHIFKDLIDRPQCDLRIVLTDLDMYGTPSSSALLNLLKYYGVPFAFVSERFQSVAHSFGVRKGDNGQESAWLHFLCKNIEVELENNDVAIAGLNIQQAATASSDFSWLRSGYFLKIEPASTPASQKSHTVTLICFGAPDSIIPRFERLSEGEEWRKALDDPYSLWDIVLDELYQQLDNAVWNIAEIYGQKEHDTLTAKRKALDDFASLHNMAKHVIYVNEAAEALLSTIDAISTYYKDIHPTQHTETTTAFLYRRQVVHSTRLRLGSLEKRIQNIIGLAFNLATQKQSQLMQQDSTSMKRIATVTLFFLPATTVATVCSSAFFGFVVDDTGTQHFFVNRFFWICWLASLCLTGFVLVVPRLVDESFWLQLYGWLEMRRLRWKRTKHVEDINLHKMT